MPSLSLAVAVAGSLFDRFAALQQKAGADEAAGSPWQAVRHHRAAAGGLFDRFAALEKRAGADEAAGSPGQAAGIRGQRAEQPAEDDNDDVDRQGAAHSDEDEELQGDYGAVSSAAALLKLGRLQCCCRAACEGA